MNYDETLKWIHGIGRFGIKPGLERMEALMEKLDNPQKKLKFIHIAGTNGKGSTAAILASILKASGYKVGLYTSPYLMAFNNRIGINGADISEEKLVYLANKLKPLVEEVACSPELGQPTEFEVVTTLALSYYAMESPDFVVMEVGLGGRLDATNIITPLVSVITNVTLDHIHILGSTVKEIAGEKAGIIKAAVPVITAAEDPAVLKVINEKAAENNSPLYYVAPKESADFSLDNIEAFENYFHYGQRKITVKGQSFSLAGGSLRYENLFIPLRGGYQIKNAATALAALSIIAEQGLRVGEADIREGLRSVEWPGRMEVLGKNPLLVIDGAHNPKAIAELSLGIREHFVYNRLILVMGVMEDKDYTEMLKIMVPHAHQLILTKPDIDRAANPLILKKELSDKYNIPVTVEEKVESAVRKSLQEAGKDDLILITGSFYTISEAREVIVKDN